METNVRFLIDLTKNKEFFKGNVHTNFINDNYADLFKEEKPTEGELIQAALATVLLDELDDIKQAVNTNDQFNPFIAETCFRVNYQHSRDIKFRYGERS